MPGTEPDESLAQRTQLNFDLYSVNITQFRTKAKCHRKHVYGAQETTVILES